MLPFAKYHGIGNDFLLIKKSTIPTGPPASWIARICDRHTGIGADGCILIDTQPPQIEIYNADGSLAAMCGNGIRCAAHYLYDEKLCRLSRYDIRCGTHSYTISRIATQPFLTRVQMGMPDSASLQLPKTAEQPLSYTVHDGTRLMLYPLYMTTMHTVVFVTESSRAKWRQWGEEICHSPLFPAKTNVDFVILYDPQHMALTTYERGVGMTLACGSGACAAAWIARRIHHTSDTLDIHLTKGTLTVLLTPKQIFLQGESQAIAKGFLRKEAYYDK